VLRPIAIERYGLEAGPPAFDVRLLDFLSRLFLRQIPGL